MIRLFLKVSFCAAALLVLSPAASAQPTPICLEGGIGGGNCTSGCGDGVCDLFTEGCQVCPIDCGPCQGANCLTPFDDLTAWWTFDHQGPLGYPDTAGHNFAYMYGGPQMTVGKVSNAVRFDGLDDYLRVDDADAIDFDTSDFSIVFWMRSSSFSVGNFLSKNDPSSPPSTFTGYYFEAGFVPLAVFNDGFAGGASVLGQNSVNDGQWHLVALTVDRDQLDGLSIYVDGARTINGIAANPQASISNVVDLIIGSNNGLQSSQFLEGDLDELQIYKRALSQSEIISIARAGSDGFCRPDAPSFCPGGASCGSDIECGFSPSYGLLGGCYQGVCVCK